MEFLFFTELITWLQEKGADINSYSIELNGKLYYTDTNSDIKKLFELFKEDRL